MIRNKIMIMMLLSFYATAIVASDCSSASVSEQEEEVTQHSVPGLWETYRQGPYKETLNLTTPEAGIKSTICTKDREYSEMPAREVKFNQLRDTFQKQQLAKGKIVRTEAIDFGVTWQVNKWVDDKQKYERRATFHFSDKDSGRSCFVHKRISMANSLLVNYGMFDRKDSSCTSQIMKEAFEIAQAKYDDQR